MDDYITKCRKAAAMLKAIMEKQRDLGIPVKDMKEYSLICENEADILTDLIDRHGFDWLYSNPLEVLSALPKHDDKETKISHAVVYALISSVGREDRHSISTIRCEIEDLSLSRAMTHFLNLIFSSVWEEYFLKDAEKREWGGCEVFSYRTWSTEFSGGTVWTGKDGKKVQCNFTCSLTFKADNMALIMSDCGSDHYASADAIAVKYKKGIEEAIVADFSKWCQNSPKPPKAEDYDILRGPVALQYYLGDHGLVPLTVSFDAKSTDLN